MFLILVLSQYLLDIKRVDRHKKNSIKVIDKNCGYRGINFECL